MMDISAFEEELEKLRSGFVFDTTKLCGMYGAALASAEAAEALAYERLESALFAEQRADDAELECDNLRDANAVLSDALETTRQTLVALTARVAELEAELASDAADENQWLDAYIESAANDGATIKRLMARVAELEAQLAAQQWRPGSETPAPDWYQTAETIDGVFSHAYFNGATWHGYPDDLPPLWYRPIPPLPAPDTEATTP